MPDFVNATDPGPGKPSPESGARLEVPDFASDLDPGPGKPSPEPGARLEMTGFASDFDPGPGKLSLESGDMLMDSTQFTGLAPLTSYGAEVRQLLTLVRPDFVSAFDPGTRTPSPESGDRLEMPDFASDLDLGKPSPESGARLNMPDFASDYDPVPGKPSPQSEDIRQLPDFDPGPRKPSPESGEGFVIPDVVSDFDPGHGRPSPESGASLEVQDFASDSDPVPGSYRRSPETVSRECYVPVFGHLTLAVSRSRHLSTSATGDVCLSDDPGVRCPSTSALLALPYNFDETPGTQLVGSDDIILCLMQFLCMDALLLGNSGISEPLFVSMPDLVIYFINWTGMVHMYHPQGVCLFDSISVLLESTFVHYVFTVLF